MNIKLVVKYIYTKNLNFIKCETVYNNIHSFGSLVVVYDTRVARRPRESPFVTVACTYCFPMRFPGHLN